MASAFSRALVALALGKAFQHPIMTRRVLLLGMACSILPDLDVIGFYAGIHYGDLWGHRGMTHSILFAGLLSAVLVEALYRQRAKAAQAVIFGYLFTCTASHGVLDALTDGGLGVGFFSPFDTSRYFFPVRPVAVSPIVIGEFFVTDTLRILASEITWTWTSTVVTCLAVRGLQRLWPIQPTAKHAPRD